MPLATGGVTDDVATRPFLDEPADFGAVALALVEQRRDEQFGAAPLRLAIDQRGPFVWRII